MILQCVKTLIYLEFCDLLFYYFYFLYTKLFKIKSRKKEEKNSQNYMRTRQEKHKKGLIYFVNSSSCWKHLPQLSEDVNNLIVQNISYDGHLWCETCNNCILEINNNVMNVKKTYKCLEDKYVCDECHEKTV